MQIFKILHTGADLVPTIFEDFFVNLTSYCPFFPCFIPVVFEGELTLGLIVIALRPVTGADAN